jgi:hypothetical protein
LGFLGLRNLSEEQLKMLWRRHEQERTAESSALLTDLRSSYSGRIAHAQSEMTNKGIDMPVGLLGMPLNFINTPAFERWRDLLNAEGRKLLVELGEDL